MSTERRRCQGVQQSTEVGKGPWGIWSSWGNQVALATSSLHAQVGAGLAWVPCWGLLT